MYICISISYSPSATSVYAVGPEYAHGEARKPPVYRDIDVSINLIVYLC